MSAAQSFRAAAGSVGWARPFPAGTVAAPARHAAVQENVINP
jgi:hypothetical protein